MAWGYDDDVGQRLVELAEDLEARAAALDGADGADPQPMIKRA